jgi:hypothetical protein
MTLIAEPLEVDHFSRQEHLDAWFDADSSSEVKIAALEFDEGNYESERTAVAATLRIELRDSTQKTIAALYELQPSEVNPAVLTQLFQNAGAFTTECVVQGLGHACADVHRACIRLMAARKRLSVEAAEVLCRYLSRLLFSTLSPMACCL